MARSKNTRATAPVWAGNDHAGGQAKPTAKHVELSQEAIDRLWGMLSPQAKEFILETDGVFGLSKLIKFWAAPQNIEYTHGTIAREVFGATWYLALVYLNLNMFREARALTINGSFIHQCYKSSIEYIKSLHIPGTIITEEKLPEHKLPFFFNGYNSIQSPDSMKAYIEALLPKDYTQMMTSFDGLSSKKGVMGYIDQISDDWSSTSKSGHRSSSSTNNGTQIKLILVDNANEDERHSFDIESSTTLKALFNDYADKRGISLRSLRFFHAGKMLFLSSAGHKTPEELSMQDQDIVKVHDTSRPQESNDDDTSDQTQLSSPSSTSKKTRAKRPKKTEAKRKKLQHQERETDIKTIEEYKVEHSKRLTKIHEEAQAQFKQKRQRLNNLVIERSKPKDKSKHSPTTKHGSSPPSTTDNPFKEGIGGKAGKSYYAIQVGEMQNLYKTTKPSIIASRLRSTHSLSPSPTLDLHGYTRKEALKELDERLKVWVDTAMKGSYPFVQPAVIVCGGGNQILSETVQEWIRSNDHVANAPTVRQ